MSRLIPLLTVKNANLVKTKLFQTYKYLGDPINAVELFGKFQVDELVLLDISNEISEELTLELLERISDRAIMPITYGGNILRLDFAEKIFKCGYDRIVIRRALKDNLLVRNLVNTYGSSSITAGIDVKVEDSGNYVLNYERIEHEYLSSYLLNLLDMGIGQLFFNYVDKDGSRAGLEYDLLLSTAQRTTSLPIILSGGCESKEEAVFFMNSYPGISVAASSIFTLMKPNDAVLIRY
jgi:cyclase